MEPARSTLYRSFLLIATSALLLLSALLRLPALAALSLAWGLLLLLATLRARRPLDGISVRRDFYPSASENDTVAVDLVLESRRSVRMIEVTDRFGPALAAEQRMLEPGPLGPGLGRRLQYECFCSRQWGLYTVGPITITSTDPAGLFPASRVLPVAEEFAVFPRIYPVNALSMLGARASLSPSESAAGRPGQSPLFLGVRDYRPGDDLRHVHWPASARRGALVSKVYEVDLTPYTTVLLDLDRRHRAGTGRKSTLEYVVRSAASVIGSAVSEGGFVQAAGQGARTLHVPPGRGDGHFTLALYELLKAAQDGTAPFHEVVAAHLPQIPAGSTVVFVSGTVFLDLGPWGDLMEALRSRGSRLLFLLVNNFSFPPISGWPPPRAEVVERMREAVFFLESRGARVQVLEDAEDLGAALERGGTA